MAKISSTPNPSRTLHPVDRYPILLSVVAHLLLIVVLVLYRLPLGNIASVRTMTVSIHHEPLPTALLSILPQAEPQPTRKSDVFLPGANSAVWFEMEHLGENSIARKPLDFFGERAYGNRFVLILDISISMRARTNGRFNRARKELIRSLNQLDSSQELYVLLFSHRVTPMFGDLPPRFARAENFRFRGSRIGWGASACNPAPILVGLCLLRAA